MPTTMMYERTRAHTTWRRRPAALKTCQDAPRREEASMLDSYIRKLMREKIESDEPVVVTISQQSENVQARFSRLADRWSREIGPISSIDRLTSHRDYREIVSLGWSVVPHLISDLQKNHRFWFPALEEITGVRPFDRNDLGNVRRMTEAWARWWQMRKELM